MKKIVLLFLFLTTTLLSFSQTQTLSSDTLHWRETKQLSWADFKGKETTGAEKEQHVSMAMLGGFVKKNPLKPAIAEVTAVFDRKKSCVNKKEQSDNDLVYFQVMFNMYELHARKLRKTVKETKMGINPEKLFQEKYNAAIAGLDEELNEYKEETQSGNNIQAITEWKEKINKELEQLNAFK